MSDCSSKIAKKMDEPTLRGIISTMAKKMISKFEIASDPKSRMKLVLEELGFEKFVLELGLESEERDYPRKNEEVMIKQSYGSGSDHRHHHHHHHHHHHLPGILLQTRSRKFF